ncbi:hypothetical protein ACFQ0O_01580 [Saccharopolyspora spinosporotrichia]
MHLDELCSDAELFLLFSSGAGVWEAPARAPTPRATRSWTPSPGTAGAAACPPRRWRGGCGRRAA